MMCPILGQAALGASKDPGGDYCDCKEEGCAWWIRDREDGRCAVKELVVYVRLAYGKWGK